MKTPKRNVTALLSFGMIALLGQTVLLAGSDTSTTTSSPPNTSAPINATPAATETTAPEPAVASTELALTTASAPAIDWTSSSPTASPTPDDKDASLALTTASAPAINWKSTVQTSGSDDVMDFEEGEWNISPFGLYSDQAGGKWGAGVAGTYYITDKIGIGGATYWTETGGTLFDNVEFEGYFRFPIKRVAPYAVASLGYQFDREYWFETFGGGLDFRAFKRFDAFADLQYRIANTSKSGDGAFLRFGLRIGLK